MLNGIKYQLSDELVSSLSDVVKSEKENIRFLTGNEKIGTGYFFIDEYNKIINSAFTKANVDTKRIEACNSFTSKELAEKIARRQLLERKLIKFSLEHGGNEIDWDARKSKAEIYYDYRTEEVNIRSEYQSKSQGTVYFATEEVAQQAIEQFNGELIQYFTEWDI